MEGRRWGLLVLVAVQLLLVQSIPVFPVLPFGFASGASDVLGQPDAETSKDIFPSGCCYKAIVVWLAVQDGDSFGAALGAHGGYRLGPLIHFSNS